MNRPDRSPRQRRVEAFLRASEYGAAGFVVFASHTLIGMPEAIAIGGSLLMIASVAVLLRHRRADEYSADIWQAAATWAIVALLVWDILLPSLVGFVEGLTHTSLSSAIGGDPAGATPSIFDAGHSPTVAYAAFYAGLLWTRFRPLGTTERGTP